ncbi:hypothetical protein Voc01_102710 [Virgisporangium ochraceum]|uniref:Bacterial sugar transferase domain-containing protein n=1 Tax=Virgisporangium ochraceum TaxID=65505 RepID=A0A8J4EHU3_9ACTN|nr:hypothetical protein Voc01_102710 [Virgisporangium ochraceum]
MTLSGTSLGEDGTWLVRPVWSGTGSTRPVDVVPPPAERRNSAGISFGEWFLSVTWPSSPTRAPVVSWDESRRAGAKIPAPYPGWVPASNGPSIAREAADRVVGAALLVLTAPATVSAAIALRIQGAGPVLRRSPRLGRDGVPFDLYQFRTMRDGDGGPHLTAVGGFLRRFSLDHLPMLVNVVRGDLALVGPRPTEPDRVDLADPRWRTVLSVRPGLVSYAILVLRGRYNAASAHTRLALEVRYTRMAGVGVDLRLLGRAAAAIVTSRGNVKAGTPRAHR